MRTDRKNFWSTDEILEIAASEDIALGGLTWSVIVGSIQCGPVGITREEVAASLKMLVSIPE